MPAATAAIPDEAAPGADTLPPDVSVAAERGYIDAVIMPSDTRGHVVRGLRQLRTKRESLPPKKHGNIPL